MNYIDPFGLKYEDVRDAWKWIVMNYPELAETVNFATNPLLDYTPWNGASYGNTVVIRESYVTDCLDDQEINDLRRTLLHELLHLRLNSHLGGLLNYATLDAISEMFEPNDPRIPGGKYHEWVYEKAADIQKYWEGTQVAGQGKPGIDNYPK